MDKKVLKVQGDTVACGCVLPYHAVGSLETWLVSKRNHNINSMIPKDVNISKRPPAVLAGYHW